MSLRTTRTASVDGQRYRISPRNMVLLCEDLFEKHWTYDELLVDESAPDDRVVLQAEVMNHHRFLSLRYAVYSGVGMRQAYNLMDHVWGVEAVLVLRQYLDGISADTLFDLLATYKEAIVELSSYEIGVGVFGWNTLFWEVRTY